MFYKNFRELRNKIPRSASFPYIILLQAIYVDKTDLIYDIACDTGPQFLSRPRRFGKSTIVSVLEELFTHGVKAFIDDKGNEHESYFKDLAIEKLWTDGDTYNVIHIDFSNMPENQAIVDKRIEAAKAVNKYSSYNLASAIESFIYGFESVIRQHFLKYNFKNDNDTTSAGDLLTDFVKKAGPGKTVLLIDEYDYPLIHIPVTLKAKEERQCYIDAVLTSIKSFYATLKRKSEYFRKIFITGITCYKDVCIYGRQYYRGYITKSTLWQYCRFYA